MAVQAAGKDQSAKQRNLLAGSSGAIVGLFFGVPPAWGAHDMGLPWMPYGVGVITIGLVVGMLIAFTVESLFPRTGTRHQPFRAPARPSAAASTIRQRLAEGKARLDRLDAQRGRQARSDFGMTAGQRIIWGELLELELQDIDEQVSHICSGSQNGGAAERHDENNNSR
jgi:hypothetical protein